MRGIMWTSMIVVLAMALSNVARGFEPMPMPTASYLDPPAGNLPYATHRSEGHQVYRCMLSELGWVWAYDGEMSDLFSWEPMPSDSNGRDEESGSRLNRVGFHYLEPSLDYLGKWPVWAFVNPQNQFSVPTSSVTARVINIMPIEPLSIPNQLYEATSHTGNGDMTFTSYIQRLNSTGGRPPVAVQCRSRFKDEYRRVPFSTNYVFWKQSEALPSKLPQEIMVRKSHVPITSFFGRGSQLYEYDGNKWMNRNSTVNLYPDPSHEAVGKHFFVPVDEFGGQLAWQIFTPFTQFTTKIVGKSTMDPRELDWLLMKKTSDHNLSKMKSVTYVQCVSTRGGLQPASSGAKGAVYESPFTAIYQFYGKKVSRAL